MKPGFSLYVLPTVLYVGVVFWLGASEMNVEMPHWLLPEDKLKHFLAFGLLVLLLFRTLRFQWPAQPQVRLALASMAGSAVIGALLEVWQSLFPYRSSEFADWVADALGALVTGCVVIVWLRKRRSRSASPGAIDSSTQMQ